MKCRHCGTPLSRTFLDLGFAPPSNAYLTVEDLVCPEKYFPLRIKVCECCWLVQTEDYAEADELFRPDYAYFSSTSASWLKHAADYAGKMTQQCNLNQDSLVIEVASNDGYLLKNFVVANIPCLGIEPTASTAAAAERHGIVVLREFFGEALGKKLASDGRQADLIAGNNVFAHVPDINDFARGLKAALKPGGTVTLEFPHLLRLIQECQFDTIYHEHFSYLSLYTTRRIFEQAGLRVWHVEELTTHGGSLRVFGCHDDDPRQETPTVGEITQTEGDAGLRDIETYWRFQARAEKVKDNLLVFLIEQRRAGKNVAAFGAAAKGNTLLNFAGIKQDLLSYVCDAAPSKQGNYLPGSHLPILPPSILMERKPDYVIILPWNIAAEIRQQNSFVGDWGGKFVVAVPMLQILD
jgi:hypothetical protein